PASPFATAVGSWKLVRSPVSLVKVSVAPPTSVAPAAATTSSTNCTSSSPCQLPRPSDSSTGVVAAGAEAAAVSNMARGRIGIRGTGLSTRTADVTHRLTGRDSVDARAEPSPLALPQHELLHLPGAGLRQRADSMAMRAERGTDAALRSRARLHELRDQRHQRLRRVLLAEA